jgi:hypothetical protein
VEGLEGAPPRRESPTSPAHKLLTKRLRDRDQFALSALSLASVDAGLLPQFEPPRQQSPQPHHAPAPHSPQYPELYHNPQDRRVAPKHESASRSCVAVNERAICVCATRQLERCQRWLALNAERSMQSRMMFSCGGGDVR